jgi:hypothetical protein
MGPFDIVARLDLENLLTPANLRSIRTSKGRWRFLPAESEAIGLRALRLPPLPG